MLNALCCEELIVCKNRRKSVVKYLLFFRSPVVSGPAFAAYCHLPTVFLSGWLIADFAMLYVLRGLWLLLLSPQRSLLSTELP